MCIKMCDQCENMRVELLNAKNQFEKLKKIDEKYDRKKDKIYKEKEEIYEKLILKLENENNEIDQFWAKRMNTLFDVAYGRIKDLEAELKHLKDQN